MAWLRIDDAFAQHPKLEGWTSAQKWALIELFSYSARHKTEGHVPADLSLLPRAVTAKVLTLAEDSGLLDRDEYGGLVIHDWKTYNPSDVTAADRMKRMRERNAKRNELVTTSVTSRARSPSRPQESESKASLSRQPNQVWDALVEVFGEPSTDTARTLRGKVCSSLTRAGATPEEVVRRAKSWPRHFDTATLTETALEKHWDALGRAPMRVGR